MLETTQEGNFQLRDRRFLTKVYVLQKQHNCNTLN